MKHKTWITILLVLTLLLVTLGYIFPERSIAFFWGAALPGTIAGALVLGGFLISLGNQGGED